MASVAKLELIAKRARRNSSMSLVGLVFVFLFSIVAFLFAETIASQLPVGAAELREVQIGTQIQEFIGRKGGIEGRLNELLDESNSQGYSEDERLTEIAKSRDDMLRVESKIENLNNELEARRNARSDGLTSRLASTIITRIGAVMMAVFMMQILLSFYRYYSRLENYYETKIASIESVSDSAAEEIFLSISPEQIVFGKEPQIAVDKLIEFVKLTK